MDVTRKAFFDLLPELEDAIEKALFISIDGEFTGIDDGSALNKNSPYDLPSEVYRRQSQKAMDFLLIQFGMCIFLYDEKTQKYTHQAYNFYVFPQSNTQHEPNPIFKCQSSSVAFLACEGFDFNKLFREGIPYLNEDEEQRRRKALEEKWKALKKPQNKGQCDVPVPPDKKQYLKDICNQVQKFLDEDDDKEHLVLDASNPYVRKLVYQEIEKEFGELICLRTDQDKKDNSMRNDRPILVFRGGDKERIKLYDEESEKRDWRDFEASIGFSHVIKLLSKSGKLIVGHNMLLDVCHTVNRFVCSLPDNYEHFKSLLHKTFPRMIDTKTMTSLPPFQKYFQSTMLQNVLETLSTDPFHIPECDVQVPGRGYSTLKAKEHEAGYDAYITGLCYLALCEYLKKESSPDEFSGNHALNADEIAHESLNKIYIWVQDAPYIHFGDEDPKPPRQHVFLVEYPHEWKRHTLVRLFKDFGPVNISFLSDKKAYVALINKENAGRVTGIKGGVVTRYDKYHSAKRNSVFDDESTSKRDGKNSTSNEKQSSTKAGTFCENKSNLKKRGGKNKNKNDDEDPITVVGAKRKKSSVESLSNDNGSKGSSNEGEDDFPIEPPPSKLKKEFETDDDWN